MSENGKTAAGELAEAVARYRVRAESEAEQRAREVQAQDAKDLIKKAQDFIDKSGIGKDLVEVADQVRPWLAWAKRGDDMGKLGISDIRGGEERNRQDLTNWCGSPGLTAPAGGVTADTKYSRSTFDGHILGLLSVDYNGQRVLELECARVSDEFVSYWRPGSVEALRLGDGAWVQGLAQMAADMRARRAEFAARSTAKAEQSKASKIEM